MKKLIIALFVCGASAFCAETVLENTSKQTTVNTRLVVNYTVCKKQPDGSLKIIVYPSRITTDSNGKETRDDNVDSFEVVLTEAQAAPLEAVVKAAYDAKVAAAK